MSKGVIIAGYVPKVRDEQTAHDFIQAPTHPANWKDAGKIAAWNTDVLPQEWEKIDRQLAYLKATGDLHDVYAVDLVKGQVFEASVNPPHASVAACFTEWLLKAYPCEDEKTTPEIFCFEPKPLVRLAGVNANRQGVMVPRFLWYQGTDSLCFDPKEMLRETDAKKFVTLAKLCKEAPGGEIELPENYYPHQDAQLDCMIVTQLVLQYRLLGPMKTESTEFLQQQVDALGAAAGEHLQVADPADAPGEEDESEDEEYDADVDLIDEGDLDEIVEQEEEEKPLPKRKRRKAKAT